jgi:nitrite reductase/ring-hydroxylating ferredoxin subunit
VDTRAVTWHRLCRADQVTEDHPFGGEVAGTPVVVFNDGARCYALRDSCSHAQARLSEGFVDAHTVQCPLHGAEFDIRTGKCISDPPYEDVQAFEVRIEGGEVYLKLGKDE